MSRLVDVDELKHELKWLEEYDLPVYHDVVSTIDEIATVDAEPVVRCKDCKKYIPCQKLPIGTSKWCGMFDRATCEMNYCGWGERRVNDKRSSL